MLFGSYRGLPKEATRLIYSLILPSVAYGMLYTDISYFLTTVQGLPDVTMGIIVTLMGVSTFSASIPLGMAADRYGKKKVLVAGNIVASVTLVIFALTTNPAVLFAAAILEGVSEGAASAATSALLAEKCDATKRNSVFSLFGFAQSMAFGAGSFAIPAVVVFQVLGFGDRESHTLLYIALAMLSLASTFLMLRISESRIPTKMEKTKTKLNLKGLFPQKSRNVLAKYVLTGATIAFGAGLFVPLMTRWMNLQYGVADQVSGPILGATSLVIGVSTLASPYLAKKIGLVKAVVATQAIIDAVHVPYAAFSQFSVGKHGLYFASIPHEHVQPLGTVNDHGTRRDRRTRSSLRNKHSALETTERLKLIHRRVADGHRILSLALLPCHRILRCFYRQCSGSSSRTPQCLKRLPNANAKSTFTKS